MKMLAPRLSLLVLFLILFGLTGCTTPTGKVYAKGLDPLNRNERGENTPVLLRVFQLKSDEKFMSKPFNDLWSEEGMKATLEGDLIKVVSKDIFASGTEAEPELLDLGELDPNCKFIGVYGLFSQTDEKDNRRVVMATGGSTLHLDVELKNYSIRIIGTR